MSHQRFAVCVNTDNGTEGLGLITSLYNQFGQSTDDLYSAVTCVIALPFNFGYVTAMVDDVEIHSVH